MAALLVTGPRSGAIVYNHYNSTGDASWTQKDPSANFIMRFSVADTVAAPKRRAAKGPGDRVVVGCHHLSDCTTELQAALDSGAGQVVVPRLPGGRPWLLSTQPAPSAAVSAALVGGSATGDHTAALYLRSHQQLLLRSGVVLEAKRGSFMGLEAGLITAAGVTNVSVVAEGSGAEFRMHKMDYVNSTLGYAPSPDRMGITLSNVSGVELRGLTVSSSGGDGIYMAGVVGGHFADLTLDNHYRQGIHLSIISF